MGYYYDMAYNQLTTNQIRDIKLFIEETENNFNMSAGWPFKRFEYYFFQKRFDFFVTDYPLWENTPAVPRYKINYYSPHFRPNEEFEIESGPETRNFGVNF